VRGYPRDAGEGTDGELRSPLDGEPLFAAFFHSSAHAMALTRTSDGVVVAVNDAMTQLFGYARDDVVGRSAADLGVRPTSEGRKAAVVDLRAGKLLEDIELRIPARDGRTFSVSASAQLLEDAGEAYLHWVLRERSQSRVVAEALSSAVSEQDAVPLLEAVLDAAPVAIALYDRLGRCIRVNAQLRNGPGGYPTGKLITDTHPQLAPLVDAVFDTGQALYNSELRGDPGGRGGGSGWWLVSYLPVHVEDGTLVSVGVVAVELTERKAFEQALLESERRLRQLLETMELAAVMTNIDGEITFVNDHLLGLTEFPRDELLGRRWVDTLAVPGREADNVRFHGRLQECACARTWGWTRRRSGCSWRAASSRWSPRSDGARSFASAFHWRTSRAGRRRNGTAAADRSARGRNHAGSTSGTSR
jgi:PAS domain S-box-containing protein